MFPLDAHGKPIVALNARAVYAYGCLIRETEQTLLRLFSEGLLSGTTHTCIGQELCQMAVVRALNDPDDVVLSNHRNHGHFLTYSGDFAGLLAEVMGREAGVCGGIGGSQHLAHRNFHSNGVQGGMTAIAAGHGLAAKLRSNSAVIAVIIGDGTLGEGLVYESMNLASIWGLPVLFVVENNRIAQTTPTAMTTGGSIEARGRAFGLMTWRLDDAAGDFLERAEDVVKVVREARRPGFLVIDTQRLGPHSKGDDPRDPAEIAAIRERDPLARLGAGLEDREEIERAARAVVDRARAAAEASPAARECARGELRGGASASGAGYSTGAGMNVRQSLNAAMRGMLRERPEVLLLGEDLHDPYGGAFKVTAGLSTEFPGRVISTPISEAGIVGAGIGLALAGFRPVVEIMFADFVTLAMDQIYNHAVKFPGMFEEAKVPLTIRTPSGGRRGYGPTHSQSPEGLMCGVPGLTVLMPSARHDAGRLLENAVLHWPHPTVFFEHKLLYGETVDRRDYREADEGELFPTLLSGGDAPDITLVAYGNTVALAEAMALRLSEEELEVGIVSPSLLAPLGRETLWRVLGGRERIVLLEECAEGSGFGAELGTMLLEGGYRGRFARVASPPCPIPAARSLEEQVLPDEERVMHGVMRVLDLI